MPALTFLAVVGLVLVGLLFVADATLENGPPPIVTSDRTGLPKPWRPDGGKTLTTIPAPAPRHDIGRCTFCRAEGCY